MPFYAMRMVSIRAAADGLFSNCNGVETHLGLLLNQSLIRRSLPHNDAFCCNHLINSVQGDEGFHKTGEIPFFEHSLGLAYSSPFLFIYLSLDFDESWEVLLELQNASR